MDDQDDADQEQKLINEGMAAEQYSPGLPAASR